MYFRTKVRRYISSYLRILWKYPSLTFESTFVLSYESTFEGNSLLTCYHYVPYIFEGMEVRSKVIGLQYKCYEDK